MHISESSFRLQSLDAFRGITIAGMILVNTSSLAPSAHPWFVHAAWNGWTPADCVFPFFLLIVGIAMAFSLSKHSPGKRPTPTLYWRVLQRGVVLFVLGAIINSFLSEGWEAIRFSGVLQRISVCYLVTACMALTLPRKAQWGMIVLMLAGYWIAYINFPIPEPKIGPEAHAKIGAFGVMSLFGMLSAIAIVLSGYSIGTWLRREAVISNLRSSHHTITMVLLGLGSVIVGQFWSLWLPINKKLWTGSYALFTAGLGLLLFATCYELIEVRGKSRWSYPAQILGLNSIIVFVASELAIKLLGKIQIGIGSKAPSVYTWLDTHLFSSWAGTTTASFLFAVGALLFWWLVAYSLYRRRWLITL